MKHLTSELSKPGRNRFVLVFAIFCMALVSVHAEGARLNFPKEGFSIKPLESSGKAPGHQILMMMLPDDGTFSPNVNVLTQTFADSLDDYKAISMNQFSQMEMSVPVCEMRGTALIMEYAGILQGRELHFYAKAVQRGGLVYLVTATATEEQWGQHKAKLIDVVDSFKLEG